MANGTITETDLQAYVDDQLDPATRLEVADYLVRNPDAAARVLADLRVSEALRVLAQHKAPIASKPVRDAASRLETALTRQRFMRGARRFGTVAALLVALVVSFEGGLRVATPAEAAVPTFVEEAMMSSRTALVRERMPSQPEVAHFDPRDIRTAAHITVPSLPKGWRVLDVQVFPSDYGPSLQMVVDAGKGRRVALFAAPGSAGLGPKPLLRTRGADTLAYWSREGMIYVLSGTVPAGFLRNAAFDLSDNQDA